MAHRLSINNGKAEMAYTGDTPWHNLGTRVDGLQTAQDMLTHAGLLWTVGTEELFLAPQLNAPAIEGFRAVIRQDTRKVLGVVTDRYVPIQNTQAGDVMDAMITEGNAHVEVAGALDDGQRLWMLAHVPADFDVVRGDTVKPYVLLAWGHDGKHGLAAKLTPIRVVCNNTLTSALGDKWSKSADVYVKHTKNAKLQLAEAQRALGLVRKQAEVTADAYRWLAVAHIDDPTAAKYFGTVFPRPEGENVPEESVERWITQQETLAHLYREGAGAHLAPETAWTAYNAITEFTDHVYPVLKSGVVSANRQQSVALGAYADVKGRALREALALVN